MSEAARRRGMPVISEERRIARLREVMQTDEYRAKVSGRPGAMTGKKHSAETRARMSAAHTGKVLVEEPGYWGMHQRLRTALTDRVCELADGTCSDQVEAAFRHDTPDEFVRFNPNGRPYSLRIEDYWLLCTSHHTRYDQEQ